MFRGCARPERDVFVTREGCDVGEQGVGERKGCWGRKRVLGHIWAISGPYLASSLVSPNHYAGNSLAFTAN